MNASNESRSALRRVLGESQAEGLAALDDLIAAQTKKLELLKRHKRGLMQHLAKAQQPEPKMQVPPAQTKVAENNTLCPYCGDMFVYEGQPEIAMGACACPLCGRPVTQANAMESGNPMLRRVIGESADKTVPKPVVVRHRQVEYDECPHCGVEIYEKHIYEDDSGTTHHSDCGGAIIPKPFDWSTIDPKWRALLEPKKD